MPMSGAWRRLDLAGGGLQEANRELARNLRRRGTAYALWLLFPVGAHRFYLAEPRGGLAYIVASGLVTVILVPGWTLAALGVCAFMVAPALFDLWWIDRRVTDLNKRLRMQAYLRPVPGAPPGFKGRLTDVADAAAPRAPSFTEQERLLTEIEHAKRDRA